MQRQSTCAEDMYMRRDVALMLCLCGFPGAFGLANLE